jgi:hypothetical protein
MKVTLNNVDIEFSLGWCHKYTLVNFELQRKRIRLAGGLNIKQAGFEYLVSTRSIKFSQSTCNACLLPCSRWPVEEHMGKVPRRGLIERKRD